MSCRSSSLMNWSNWYMPCSMSRSFFSQRPVSSGLFNKPDLMMSSNCLPVEVETRFFLFLTTYPLFNRVSMIPAREDGRPMPFSFIASRRDSSSTSLPAVSMGHIWLQEEVEVTTDFQRQFNEYLDTFHDAISAVAEVYGIYHECQKTAELVGLLKDVVGDHPWNPVAVAFHSKRNDIYSSIVVKGINMLNDIKMVCFENSKMTEYERNHILSSLRPQLRVINKELLHLYIYLKHTTMLDVWHEIEGRAVDYTPPKNKKEVAERCIKRWKQNAGMK